MSEPAVTGDFGPSIAAVVLAGGFGTRLKNVLPELPKPMAPVAGKPFLEWVVRYLLKQGVNEVVISTGYRAEVVEKYFQTQPVPGARVQCIAEPTPLGTAGGFLHCVRQSGLSPEGWLLLNGDTLAFASLARAMEALRDPETGGVVFGREVPDTSRYGSLVTDAGGRLIRFAEKQPGHGMISTGVYLFRAALVRKISGQIPLSLERDVFPALTASGTSLKVLRMDAPFLDIGLPETLREADDFVRANQGGFAGL